MAINTIEHNNPISINEARVAIPILGPTLTPIIKGEPGCGKSTLLKMLEQDMGDNYDYIYVDCPLKDMGDTAMSVPDNDRTKLLQVISDLFKLDSPKPKVIMLDEFMKTPKLLQTMWTRLMLERYVGDKELPGGSIVFATSNNSSDGVGDTMLAHAGNRVCIYNLRKPTANEWLSWAGENGISAEVRACIAMFPNMLASYLDGGQEENPYIFNPSRKMLSFVTPRSLAKADVAVIRNRGKLGANLTQASLAGTIGAAAAEKMAAFLSLANELVSIKDVISDPDSVRMPEKPAALFMMMFNAVDTIETQDQLAAFMKFINRVPSSEVQSVFFTMVMQNKRTSKIAILNEQIKTWVRGNYELMV
jgi:energy-coupling factor transporter ATP-binding protein EcfA2